MSPLQTILPFSISTRLSTIKTEIRNKTSLRHGFGTGRTMNKRIGTREDLDEGGILIAKRRQDLGTVGSGDKLCAQKCIETAIGGQVFASSDHPSCWTCLSKRGVYERL